MGLAYDSGWVPVASGTINANVDLSNINRAQVVIAASGAVGAGATSMGWSAGGGTPVPWVKSTPAFRVTPMITGSYTVAAPGINVQNIYYLGSSMSGANHLDDWVPDRLYVSTVAGAGSWARIVVTAK